MAEEAKMTMLLCSGLELAEQEKVERLDGPISGRFIQAGVTTRIVCQGRGAGDQRVLDFTTSTGSVGSVRAAEFLSALDHAAVAAIVFSES